jgi:hypothetical protein
MNGEPKKPSKASVVASDTRKWTSGIVRFSVLTVEGHPEENYIIFEKTLVGKPLTVGVQRFRLRLKDWNNLKRLIEIELPEKHGWVLENSGISLVHGQNAAQLSKFIDENPEFIGKMLALPNLRLLSAASFESLSALAIKIYQVQSKNIEIVLRNLSKASPDEFVQFASILKDLRLGQVASLVNLVKQKLEIIDLFDRLTGALATREKEVHQLIENNPWIVDKKYEILMSDKQLAEFLSREVKEDPEMKKRPDLIVRKVPRRDELVLIELKRPEVKLTPLHVGQILQYKSLIRKFKSSAPVIECYLFGYQRHPSHFIESSDVQVRTYSELVSSLRDEYREYLRVLEEDSRTVEIPEEIGPSVLPDEEDIPF